MEKPESCEHDFRRVFPRHITQQVPTNPGESVLAVLCCNCGFSPVYFEQLPGIGRPKRIEVNGEWPQDRRITDYEWTEAGPRVFFECADDAG